MSKPIYTVYWIHRADDTNPYADGYVGITSKLDQRLNEHKKYNKTSIVYKALKKYDDIVITELAIGVTEDEAKTIEYGYRCTQSVGWNLAVGGGIPPNHANANWAGTKITLKGDFRTPSQKEASLNHSKRMKGRTSPNKGKACPEHLKIYYSSLYKGQKKSGSVSQITKTKLSEAAKSRPTVQCPHCDVKGQYNSMQRWHFDRCRNKL